MTTVFTPGFILKTLFLYALENQRYFAEHYINCDKSLVYKWINDTVILPKKHITNVVRFAIEQTKDSEQLQIRNDIQQALSLAPLCDESRLSLSKTEDFSKFLNGALLYSIAFRMEQKEDQDNKLKASPPKLQRVGINFATLLICGFFALNIGGILWACLNRLLGWQYFMGGSGNEPTCLASVIWGVLTNTPIIVCALIAARKDQNLLKRMNLALIMLYASFCGFGAFIFYNSGLRTFIEQMSLNYGLQECAIAGIYGLVISGFPLFALYFILRRVGIALLWRIVGIFLPPAAAVLAVLGTYIINRPELEVAQLRGFVVALTLRLCMFLTAFLYISDILHHRNHLHPILNVTEHLNKSMP